MAKKHHHTGKIHHHQPMHDGSHGLGTPDPHADVAHHKANKEHGMAEGLSPTGQDFDEGQHEGEGMADNEC